MFSPFLHFLFLYSSGPSNRSYFCCSSSCSSISPFSSSSMFSPFVFALLPPSIPPSFPPCPSSPKRPSRQPRPSPPPSCTASLYYANYPEGSPWSPALQIRAGNPTAITGSRGQRVWRPAQSSILSLSNTLLNYSDAATRHRGRREEPRPESTHAFVH